MVDSSSAIAAITNVNHHSPSLAAVEKGVHMLAHGQCVRINLKEPAKRAFFSCRLMEEKTGQMSHLGLTNMNWTSLNLNLSLLKGQQEQEQEEDLHNLKLEVEEEMVEGNTTSLNRLDTGLVYEAVVQVSPINPTPDKEVYCHDDDDDE